MPRRGEIWWVALDPTVGSEIKKTRPCLVVSSEVIHRRPIWIIVPVTEWKPKHGRRAWCVRIEPDRANGLSKVSAADASQVRCASTQDRRFRDRLGSVRADIVEDVVLALGLCVDHPIAR